VLHKASSYRTSAFYNAGVNRFDDVHRPHLVPGERARWLAAVLIVTTIAATSAIVRLWPASHGPGPILASRSLPLLDAPIAPVADVISAMRPVPELAMPSAERAQEPVAVDIADAAVAQEELTAPAPKMPEAPLPAVPALASRRLELFGGPSLAAVAAPRDVPAPSHTFVELPAVAVSRAVTFAGRGIKTGIRATTAAFKAVF
jgi:hypothetical protein